MALDIETVFAAVESHAAASGQFERVNGAEPGNAPGHGITAAVWVETIGPYPAGSSLISTTSRIELSVRLYLPANALDPDRVDPAMVRASDALMAAYSGDFTLGGIVRDVDLLGEAGTPLQARAGYLPIDGQLYRVMTITLPLLVADLWTQAP